MYRGALNLKNKFSKTSLPPLLFMHPHNWVRGGCYIFNLVKVKMK